MRRFKQILEDIERGENIDLYVTASSAVIVTVLNVLGLVSASRLAALNVAILALITFTILGNRHSLAEVANKLSGLTAQPGFLEEFPPDFASRLEEAKDVWLTGTHHGSALTAYYHLLETKVRRGDTLKILLLDPNGSACSMAAMRFPGKVTAAQEKMRIRSSLDTLLDLQAIAPDRVQVRVIDFLVEYTAFLLDPTTQRGTVYLERYTFKISGGSRKPKFIYTRRDGRWFEHLVTEVTNLWESATPWKPSPAEPLRAGD